MSIYPFFKPVVIKKQAILIAMGLSSFSISLSATADAHNLNAQPQAILNLIPSIQEYIPPSDAIQTNIGKQPSIYYNQTDLAPVAQTLYEDLQALSQPIFPNQPVYQENMDSDNCPDQSICLIEDNSQEAFEDTPNPQNFQLQQGYELGLNRYSATLTANNSSDGIFNATRTLLQLLAQSHGSGQMPAGTIKDWPGLENRGMMLDLGRKFFPLSYLESLVKILAFYKINELHLHLNEAFVINTPGSIKITQSFRLNDPVNYPGLASQDGSYTQQDIEQLKTMAEAYHVSLVPEIDMPGHAVALTQYYQNTYAPSHPNLPKTITFDPTVCPTMASMTIGGVTYPGWTMDVLNPESIQFAEGLIKNFMPWFGSENGKFPHQGQYFHIGTDEYQNNAAMNACPSLIKACTNSDGSILPACQGPKNPDSSQSAIEPGGLFVNFIDQINQDVFINGIKNGTNPDKTIMRIWTGWNAATPATLKYSTSPIDPDSSIYIDSWLVTQPLSDLMKKYHVMNTSYQTTYLTPGYADQNWDNPFPQAYVLNSWFPDISLLPLGWSGPPPVLPAKLDNNIGAGNLLGTSFSLWTDSAATKPFWFFDTLLQRPLKLLANAAWFGAPQPQRTLNTFIASDQAIGNAPGLTPIQSYYSSNSMSSISSSLIWSRQGFVHINQDTPINLQELPTPWTFSVWVNINSNITSSMATQILLQSPLADDDAMPLSLNLVNANSGNIGYTNGTTNMAAQYSMVGIFDLPAALNTPHPFANPTTNHLWTHLTFVGTQAGVAIYVNDQLQGSALSVMPLPMQTLGSSQNTLQGYLCDPAAYNQALIPESFNDQNKRSGNLLAPSIQPPKDCVLG